MDATSQKYLEISSRVKETKALISELCRHFYYLGWLSGTGGSISIKVHDGSIPKPQQLIVISPSGIQKERMMEEDMYLLSPGGSVLSEPLAKPWPHKPPNCSDCSPLFLKTYEMRNAGAIIHSHGIESCIVTMINPLSKEFRITRMEMMKGIEGHGYHDTLVIPIIENTAHERELTESFAQAIEAYPKTTAVLVRNHGVYVWGDSWISAKAQAECYHYLFDAAIKLHQLGLDWSTPSHSPNHIHRNGTNSLKALNNGTEPSRQCIVLRSGVTISKFIPPKGHTNWTYVVDDLSGALEKWHSIGIKVYIYSSTFSRLEQRICFGNTNYGDLRKYLCGFFDNKVGDMEDRKSYIEIKEYLGVDNPSEILFVTGLYKEAKAAKAAGLEVIISQRENGPLPEKHSFRTIKSFSEI